MEEQKFNDTTEDSDYFYLPKWQTISILLLGSVGMAVIAILWRIF